MQEDIRGGGWQGWWRQGLREGHEVLSLSAAGGLIQGSGRDEDGAFSLNGQIYADGTASLTKRYTQPLIATPPSLAYLGQWNGRVIRGSWVDERYPDNHGPFLLWPRAQAPAAEAAREQDVPLALPSGDGDPVRVRPFAPAQPARP